MFSQLSTINYQLSTTFRIVRNLRKRARCRRVIGVIATVIVGVRRWAVDRREVFAGCVTVANTTGCGVFAFYEHRVTVTARFAGRFGVLTE